MSAPAAPLDLGPIDLSAYADGNTGIPYAWTFAGEAQGPHLMICAIVHGNEVCGAHALARLLEGGVRPGRGRLSLVFANVAAYETFDAANAGASRFLDEDLNRVWSPAVLDSDRRSRELTRARALWPLIDDVDHLLDIHSMQTPSPPLALAGLTAKGRDLARAVGAPTHVVIDAGHAEGTRLRDYGDFSDPSSPRSALLVECGQHWRTSSRDVAIDVCRRFLAAFGALDGAAAASIEARTPAGPQRLIEVTAAVTIGAGDFAFAADYQGLEVVPAAGTVIGTNGKAEVRTPYDNCVIIMPSRRLRAGQTAVRFGRYIGGGATP
jgi:predicted deacylase